MNSSRRLASTAPRNTASCVRVMTPMAMPMVATISIIGFQSMWNELPFSMLILQQESLRTLTVGIAVLRGEYGLRVPILSAALVHRHGGTARSFSSSSSAA